MDIGFNNIYGYLSKIRPWRIAIGWNLLCKKWSITHRRKEGKATYSQYSCISYTGIAKMRALAYIFNCMYYTQIEK